MVQMILGVALVMSMATGITAPVIAPDWQGRAPSFPPGSLFWRTNEFTQSPVLYRTLLTAPNKPLAFAVVRLSTHSYAYLFISRFDRFSDFDPYGRCIARAEAPSESSDEEVTLVVDLTSYLLPGQTVALVVSAPENGFSLEGALAFQDGSVQWLNSDPSRWRAQKFPPLTVLEFEPCMRPDFDDQAWFPVRVIGEAGASSPPQLLAELRAFAIQAKQERLQQQGEESRWRLTLLRDKGIALVDDETSTWGGAERLPIWVRELANHLLLRLPPAVTPAQEGEVEALLAGSEALALFVWAQDEATNLENHILLWQALKDEQRAGICKQEAHAFKEALAEVEKVLQRWHTAPDKIARKDANEVVWRLRSLRSRALALRKRSIWTAPVINDLNSALENKFGWFDTTHLLDNDIARWGLKITTSAEVFASPLSPAAFVTVKGTEFTLSGWNALPVGRVYNQPANTAPVCMWIVIEGKVQSLRPQADGTVYDRMIHGRMSENWILLVPDLSRGGGLPVQFVFLQAPQRIVFRPDDKGLVRDVTVFFERPGAHLFVLKPLKEWRGLLRQAQTMTASPLNEQENAFYLQQCRLWSRALLNYPVTYSETFIRDPNNRYALIVADVYNYWSFRDDWNTSPLKLASLPPLASYARLLGYPLEVLSEAQVVGSWGNWGDHIAVLGQGVIIYRIPLHPIKRFGGFTAFCFGPTDIGMPGNITELELIKRTGANTFRPQHNRTDEPAMQLAQWCWERGLQNVFNTDEKWVLDIVEHFRTLAQKCRDLPPDAVAYDLLNEPETRDPVAYNSLIRRITKAIREIDKTHLIYVEVIPPWGPKAQPYPEEAFANLEPTGDPLTVYSFHDYEYRLMPRYPGEGVDIRTLLERWLPVFVYSVKHNVPVHLGEFGAFEQTEEDIYANRSAITMLLDHFRIFDQFGWHFHYYSNRGLVRERKDGSLEESLVQEAFRRYFGRARLNAARE